MQDDSVLYRHQDGVTTIILNRPDRLNAFTSSMHEALRGALDQLQEDGARCLIIRGAGRAFCAGQDLADRQVAPGEQAVDLGASVERDYAPLIQRLRTLPLPVIAQVHGVAAGAGCNLALACDLVFAGESASFLQPYCKLGLIPDAGGSYFLPRLVGRARALGLALLGDKISARQAAEMGLIWACVPDAELEATVEGVARQLATGPSFGYAQTKRAIEASLDNDLATQLALEARLMRECGYSEDYREGVAAFLEKRAPRFIGR